MRSPRLGLLHQQIAQPLRREDESFDRLDGLGIHQRRAGGELRQFAQEIARPVGDDRFALVRSATLGDFYLARKDDDQAGRNIAGLTMRSPAA